MNRKTLTPTIAMVSALAVVLLAVSSPKSEAKEKTNVLFIAIDDLNDWVGCLNEHPQASTPNIDRLADRGMLFTKAYCQAPICGPSRASLLSGKYPHTTGFYQQPKGSLMEQDREHFRGHLLPEYFAQHGYKTLAVGKITHGYAAKTAFHKYGGKFAGSGPKPQAGKRFNYFLPDVPWTGTQTDWGAYPDSDKLMPDHQAADWAVEQLNATHSKPFFLAVGFVRPHVPFYTPQKWLDQFPLEEIQLPAVRNDDLDDVPPISRAIHELPKYPDLEFLQRNDNEQFRKCVQAYLACTAFVDHQVGKVMDALDQSDHAGNTVVVLFSDHGYHLGEKNIVSKHTLWEESLRVPMVIVPAKSDKRLSKVKGQACGKPVGLIDLYPTLVDYCNLPANMKNEGHSLLPLLKDPDSEWREATVSTYSRGNHSIRSDRYRYIRYMDGSEELYDHQQDPHEWKNLAGDAKYVDIIKRLRKSLPATDAKYHASTNKKAINAWFKEHLDKIIN